MSTPSAVEDVFLAALEKAAPAARAAYLDDACRDDPELRRRVERLLQAHPRAGDFLNEPVVATNAYVATGTVGTVVAGRYKLLEQIGEGGMGTVWVAEQTEPVRRKVALKVIKPGMDSRSVLARFEAERQALAMMDHPNIAKVLDGGLTDDHRPFFVMEYVKGVPITEYCDSVRLSVPERLGLFVQVCHAVQHAHQKGIIHRDLKPSNILVAPYDDKPVPKVIDFGLAKAMHQSLTERTLHTAHEMVLGTPLYMSPEQAQLNNLDVDTRSDIYSLGVLLYELLTGTTPLEKKRFKEAAWDEVRRLIREQDPPRPSVRLSSTHTLPSLAACRQTEPTRLTKQVRGELDWIVMKALEKDRSRRYETANGFAMDVQRFLAGDVVLAAPPSAAYRLRKFVRRNRGKVAAAATVLLVLVAGVLGTTLGLLRAVDAEAEARDQRDQAVAARHAEAERANAEARERRRAELAEERANDNAQKATVERDRAVAAQKEAKIQSAISGSVKDFLLRDLLRQADADMQAEKIHSLGRSEFTITANPTIKELLERTAAGLTANRIEQKFPDQPLVQAEILYTVGRAYYSIGEYPKAIAHLERAVDLCRTHLGPEARDTLTTIHHLAQAHRENGEVVKAIAEFEKNRDTEVRVLGPEHRDTLSALHELALSYAQAGRNAEAMDLLQNVLAVRTRLFGPQDPHTLATMNNLAGEYTNAGKYNEAIRLNEKVRDILIAVRGPDDPHTLKTLQNLAYSYQEAGEVARAIALLEKIRDTFITQFGRDHPGTLGMMDNLARAYLSAGRTAEALALLERSVEVRKRVFGPEHRDTLNALHGLAEAYRDAGRNAEAIALLEKVRDADAAKPEADARGRLVTLRVLATVYISTGRSQDAIALLEQVRDEELARFGPDSHRTWTALGDLARAYTNVGRNAEAISILEKLQNVAMDRFGADHRYTLPVLHGLAQAYLTADRTNEAIALFEKVQAAAIRIMDANHRNLLIIQHNLAGAYQKAGRIDEAITLFEKVTDARIKVLGREHPDTLNTLQSLARLYKEEGKLDLALPLFEMALPIVTAKSGAENPTTLVLMRDLGVLYWTMNKLDKAIAVFEGLVPLDERVFGAGNTETLLNKINLGVNYRAVGRFAEAIPLLEEGYRQGGENAAIAWVGHELLKAYIRARNTDRARDLIKEGIPKLRRTYQDRNVDLARALCGYGACLLEMQAFADAEPLVRESLAIFDEKQPAAWRAAYAKTLLGGALLGQKRYGDAEPLLVHGYEGLKDHRTAIAPVRQYMLTDALERLVQLYEATGKPDEAAKWRAELEAAKATAKP